MTSARWTEVISLAPMGRRLADFIAAHHIYFNVASFIANVNNLVQKYLILPNFFLGKA
jgi:hypothetical protein